MSLGIGQLFGRQEASQRGQGVFAAQGLAQAVSPGYLAVR